MNTFGEDFNRAALLSALEAAYQRAALSEEEYKQFCLDIENGTFDYEAAVRRIEKGKENKSAEGPL